MFWLTLGSRGQQKIPSGSFLPLWQDLHDARATRDGQFCSLPGSCIQTFIVANATRSHNSSNRIVRYFERYSLVIWNKIIINSGILIHLRVSPSAPNFSLHFYAGFFVIKSKYRAPSPQEISIFETQSKQSRSSLYTEYCGFLYDEEDQEPDGKGQGNRLTRVYWSVA